MALNNLVEDIPEDSLVCFRFDMDEEWILISRWTTEIKEAYLFAHSEPYTSQKGNTEPLFPEAVYEKIPLTEQTPEKLREFYQRSEKSPTFRTKIHSHELVYVL